MAVEQKRGCGYRKVGGLYLVSGGAGVPCDRLPIELSVCPCCHGGIKQSRGWTWIDVAMLVGGDHGVPCLDLGFCPLCHDVKQLGKAGLLWIGEKFYPTPADFDREGVAMGISRRISAIPRNFKVGETWILLAHPKVVPGTIVDQENLAGFGDQVAAGTMTEAQAISYATKNVFKPGIFKVWRPSRIEKICKESERGTEAIAELEKKGITPVFVPDDDKDHMGSVHDKAEESEEEVTA
jgi:hypothetical protein